MTRAALVLALALGACQSRPEGVPVGQAADAPAPWTLPPLDTTDADERPLGPPPDTLATGDTLAADPEDAARHRAPSPVAAWEAVRAAVRGGRAAAWRDATAGTAGADAAWDALATDGPFRDGLLALAPRDLVADGAAREARVTVGYDAAGRVVPQDEAERDRTLVVRLDVVDGAYRVVAVEAP